MPSGLGGLGKGGSTAFNKKMQICSYWRENRCNRGALCGYAHGEQEIQDAIRQQAMREKAAAANRGPPRASMADRLRQQESYDRGRRYDDRDRGRMGDSRRPVQGRGREPIRSRSRERRMRPLSFASGQQLPGLDRSECIISLEAPPRRPPAAAPATQAQAPAPSTKEPKAPDAAPAEGAGKEDSKAEGQEGSQAEAPGDASPSAGAAPGEETKEPGASPSAGAEASDAPKEAAAPPKQEEKKPEPKKADGNQPAAFLVSEEGFSELEQTYGLGARLLKAMGWKAGAGLGKDLEGELEPLSLRILLLPTTHYGRKDRRCLGKKKPKRFRDSDESSPSRTVSTSEDTSCESVSSASSASSKKKKVSKRKKKRKRRSRSSSRSSNSTTSSSSSSRSRKRRRRIRKDSGKSAKFSNSAPPNAEAPPPKPETTPPIAQAVRDPPEIAQAKKQVLAKLTDLQKVEPKEQRAKEFRLLLREWHPDKNPDKLEMATAVFQFLQKGKSLLNLK